MSTAANSKPLGNHIAGAMVSKPNGKSSSYTATAKAFHWLMAFVIIVGSAYGIYGALFLHYGVSNAETAAKIR